MRRTGKSHRALTETERIVLAAYFGENVSGQALANAIETLELEGSSFDGNGLPSELDAAVAEILLQSLRDELPQWAIVQHDQLVLGRKRTTPLVSPFQPVHLFTINWANSGPGFSWPVAYHATMVVDFRRTVVTASADSEELYGFTDFAIGRFSADEDLLQGTHKVIVGHWSQAARDGQSRWEQLFETGHVDADVAFVWADEVAWREDV